MHDNVKRQIVANSERDTVLVFRKFRNTARVARNAVAEEILDISQREDSTFEDIAHLASGERGRAQVLSGGQMDDGMWWAGQSQGLIGEVASDRVVIEQIMADAEGVIGRLSAATGR